MKIIILVIITVAVFSGLGLWPITYGNTISEEENMYYGISLMIDKVSYSVGEPIIIALKIFNYTEEDVVFHFNASQRYDFIIEDEKGSEVWRWSNGRMFAQMLGKESLGQHNQEVMYIEEYKSKLSPGYYKVTGVFVAQDRAMSGSIILEVK